MKIIPRTNQNHEVNGLLTLYKQDCYMRGLSKRTCEGYYNEISSLFKDEPILTEDAVRNVVAMIMTKDWSYCSKDHFIRELRTFTKWAAENNYIQPVVIKNIKGQKPVAKLYSEEECAILLTNYDKRKYTSHRLHCMIALILSAGPRANTVINIKLSDVDFNNHTIIFAALKNKSTYYSPMTMTLEKELRNYISMWNLPEDGYLFCNENGSQLTYNAFRLQFERHCKAVNVKCRGVHALRRTFATEYIKAGGNVFNLQLQLTHSSIQTTQQYVKLANVDVAKTINQFALLDKIAMDSKNRITRKV